MKLLCKIDIHANKEADRQTDRAIDGSILADGML
jgi:hypothetical protein